MAEAFSINREFDFVRLDGLRRATGLPAHEWDLYIVKELIDNALDADEALWQKDHNLHPRVEIWMEYIPIPARRSQQLFVQVGNRTAFPVEQIADIFATQWYTSRKAFHKGLTRGALGNALKTLLGIPYALRQRVAGDWQPELKPLSILCGGQEFLPRYEIDATAQTIQAVCDAKGTNRKVTGTVIQVGLDHFEQEQPRTLTQLQQLTEQYHLCNPHVEFQWAIELGDEEWAKTYAANSGWNEKFQGLAPVQWYPPSTFQEVLGALYRRQNKNQTGEQLPVKTVSQYFAGFDTDQAPSAVAPISEAFGQVSLTATDIESPVTTRLYEILCRHSLPIPSIQLGYLGAEHVKIAITQALPLEAEIFYERMTDAGDDPNVPFVIEGAIARLKAGRREIWTALNFSPTYSDPFFRRWLRAPIQPDEPVMGLRGMLDAYGLVEDEPVLLFLHVICPNIEHHEFSKTEINHLPFKQVLGEMLDRLLQILKQAQEEAELRLEQRIFQVLEAILGELAETERFVFDQLLAKLQARLSQDPELSAWLETPEAPGRLRTYIANYQSRNPVVTQHVARPTAGTVSLPLHPDRHFSIQAEHISPELLAQHHISKILYVQGRELEPVIIENGWLCQFDLALLHNASSPEVLEMALVHCFVGSRDDIPILILHNANESGQSIISQIQDWLVKRQLDPERIVDLGLNADKSHHPDQPTRLVEMMPGELTNWFTTRLTMLGVPIKTLPTEADIRRDIRKQFDQHLRSHLWEGVSSHLHIARLLNNIEQQLGLAKLMSEQALDAELKQRLNREKCADSYATALQAVVDGFFETFMQTHGQGVRELVQTHITEMHSGKIE